MESKIRSKYPVSPLDLELQQIYSCTHKLFSRRMDCTQTTLRQRLAAIIRTWSLFILFTYSRTANGSPFRARENAML